MSDMTQRKHFLSMFLILIKFFIEVFNLLRNLMYVLPDNRSKTEALTYFSFIDSITQPDSSLMRLIIYFI